MPTLDHYAAFVISAFVITCVLLGGYSLYLWSRYNGLQRRLGQTRARPAGAEGVSSPSPAPTRP